MDLLKQAADSFIKLKEIAYRIILSAGRKRPLEIIELNFCDSDFFHILGLQYLKDIDLPKAKTKLFTEINKGSLSEEYIAKSQFFDNLQLGYSIKQRIEMAINIEQYMDSDDFNVAIYKIQHENRTKIRADYIITCKGIPSVEEYYIFIRKRKEEEKYSIVSCFPKAAVAYWGGKRYVMLKEKIQNNTVSTLFRHPGY